MTICCINALKYDTKAISNETGLRWRYWFRWFPEIVKKQMMRWYAQDEVNQEESEQNEVDGMKKGTDSTGKVMHV